MSSSRLTELERRLSVDEWDVDAWQSLLTEISTLPFPAARPYYVRITAQFPSVARFFLAHVDHLKRETPDEHPQILGIYEKAVANATTSVDLWLSYLAFLNNLAINAVAGKNETDAIALFERALKMVGLDLNSTPIWTQYVQFLQKHVSMSDSQRRDVVRRVYQRAVRNPMHNLDTLWRDYTNFEHTSNNSKEYSRTVIAENQPKNIDARAEFRARRTRREGLTVSALPVPPRGRPKETSQAHHWKKVIAAEKDNRSSLPDLDLIARVINAYESALAPMYRYPDFWIEYVTYVYQAYSSQLQKFNAAKPNAKDNSNSNSNNSNNNNNNNSAASDPVTSIKHVADAVQPLLERAVAAVPANVALHVQVSWLYVRIEQPAKALAAMDALCANHPSPLAYVHYMRLARKLNSRDAARKVFGKARKDPKGSHPSVYVAAARMEFANKESKVAKNVFEFGLKNFTNSPLIAAAYVKWLWGVGDFEYARVVLKKVMPNIDGVSNDVRLLWETWIELEELIGDTASVDKVEAMWKESANGKNNTVLGTVMRRTRFLNFEGMSEDERAAAFNNRTTNKEESSGQTGASGGRRDPRTGRRVGASAANKDGPGGGSSSGATGAASATGRNGRMKDGGGGKAPTSLKEIMEALNRLVSLTPPVPPLAPPPAIDMLVKLISNTPDSIADTPSYKRMGNAQSSKQDGVLGKKRKNDEIQNSNNNNMQSAPLKQQQQQQQSPQPQDVFQARQAAKQSRTR